MAVKRAERAGALHPLSFRVTPDLKAKLEQAASDNGRSVTAELLSRLELSFAQSKWDAELEEIKRQNVEIARQQSSRMAIEEAMERASAGIPYGPKRGPSGISQEMLEDAIERAIARVLKRLSDKDEPAPDGQPAKGKGRTPAK